jgi:hydroxymethylbilane synthase
VKIRLGTRGSRLALAQSHQVAGALAARGADVEVIRIRTSGDRLAETALAEFGGKALFVREIEEALLAGQIDMGVHSLKDLPARLPSGLVLAAYPAREDPRDALLSRADGGLDGLAVGASVGTSSLRRAVLLRLRRPDVRAVPIRGNVDTRVEKLRSGLYDALLIASAGLNRLAVTWTPATLLDPEEFIPAGGQGVLAVEVRQADRTLVELVAEIDDPRARTESNAERAFLARLGAGCHVPVAVHARLDGSVLTVNGMVASRDASLVLRAAVSGPASDASQLGLGLADELLAKGARPVLEAEAGLADPPRDA